MAIDLTIEELQTILRALNEMQLHQNNRGLSGGANETGKLIAKIAAAIATKSN